MGLMHMEHQTDHDILVTLKNSLDIFMKQQQAFIERSETQHTTLANRVSVLENKDSRDSEKFKAISEEVRRSLNNSARIDALTTELSTLRTEISTVNKIKDTIASRNWSLWLIVAGLVASQLWQWIIK